MGNGRNLKEKKVRKNLIQIQTQVQIVQGHYQYHHRDRYRDRISQLESTNIITYDLDALKEIKHATKKDNRYKQLPFGTVKAVRELKLNRTKRGSRDGQNGIDPLMFVKPPGVVKKILEHYHMLHTRQPGTLVRFDLYL